MVKLTAPYGIHRQLTDLGWDCQVVAPSLIPKKAGDRVKTDRRDSLTLARLHRAGELTAVWVPDGAQEALRDLTQAREDMKHLQRQSKQRLLAFLLRHGAAGIEKIAATRFNSIVRGLQFFEIPTKVPTSNHGWHSGEVVLCMKKPAIGGFCLRGWEYEARKEINQPATGTPLHKRSRTYARFNSCFTWFKIALDLLHLGDAALAVALRNHAFHDAAGH